jgi:hypothetical protein
VRSRERREREGERGIKEGKSASYRQRFQDNGGIGERCGKGTHVLSV